MADRQEESTNVPSGQPAVEVDIQQLLELDLATEDGQRKFAELVDAKVEGAKAEERERVAATLKATVKKYRELKADHEALKNRADRAGEDAQKALQLEQELTATKLKLAETLEGQQAANKAHQLELYRRDALAKLGSDAIPEMITGSTPEEIDASVARCKTRMAEIRKTELERIARETGRSLDEITRQTTTGQRVEQSALKAKDVAAMSLEQYLEHRKELLAEAENRLKATMAVPED
jgi:mevalonate kinase